MSGLATADDLLSAGLCSAACLLASGEHGRSRGCDCRCKGQFHGALKHAEVPHVAGALTLVAEFGARLEVLARRDETPQQLLDGVISELGVLAMDLERGRQVATAE